MGKYRIQQKFTFKFRAGLSPSQRCRYTDKYRLGTSINDIVQTDKRLENFKAVKNGMVFNNNKLRNHYGGTAFWENGTVQPDRILADLIRIFYPENKFTPDTLTFYIKLNIENSNHALFSHCRRNFRRYTRRTAYALAKNTTTTKHNLYSSGASAWTSKAGTLITTITKIRPFIG